MNLLSKYRTELYGFSILWIMIFHGNAICHVDYFHRFPALAFLDRAIAWGNIGVEVFILLAGISAYYSFSKDPNILSFYKKRAKRLYFPVLIICWPYWIWQLLSGAIGIKQFFLDILLVKFWVTGDQQIWFVSTIAMLYLLYPVIHLFFEKKNYWTDGHDGDSSVGIARMSKAIELLAVILALIFLMYKCVPEYYKLVEIGLNRIPIFIMGVWLGPLVKNNTDIDPGSILYLLLITLFGIYLLWIRESKGIYRRWHYELMGTPLTILLSFGMQKAGRYIRLFFSFFGRMSLELYLAHIIAIRLNRAGFFFPYVEGAAKNYIVLLCIAVLAAWAAFVIESFLKRIPERKQHK